MASQTPTGASKRLLTMKFMQRGAAASASSPNSPSTPVSDDGRPSKRPRTQGRSSPGGSDAPRYAVSQAAAQAALDEEERKRQAVMKKRAEQLGDSHWVLDAAKLPRASQAGAPLRIVQVGFSQIDGGHRTHHDDDDEDEEEQDVPETDGAAFRRYGPVKKADKTKDKDKDKACAFFSMKSTTYANTCLQSQSDSDSESDSDSDDSSSSDSSSEESDDGDDASQNRPGRASYGSQKRDEIRSKKKVEREKARELATKRRTKEVRLNTLTSISGSGSFSSKGSNNPGRRR